MNWIDPYKYNCGNSLPSSCIIYTGKDLTILKDAKDIECNANLNEVIFQFDYNVKSILDSTNYTSINKRCLVFDNLTIDSKGLHQLEIDEICAAKSQLTIIENKLNNLNIGNELIRVDLGSLAPSVSACEISTDTYKLITVINLLVDKINDLQQQINNS